MTGSQPSLPHQQQQHSQKVQVNLTLVYLLHGAKTTTLVPARHIVSTVQ